MNLPNLKIRNSIAKYPIIQGGMGIGYSNFMLAGTVAKERGIGVLSSAAADYVVGRRHGKKLIHKDAIAQDVRDAKKICGSSGIIGMNIMSALVRTWEDSILGSMDGGVDIIISGAGLPITLPIIASEHARYNDVALVPIVSSGRAFELIIKKWLKSSERLPDAVIVEGPMAGGHLGWRKAEEILDPKNKLESIVEDVLKVAKQYNNIPVIAAGGIYSQQDIKKYLHMGCSGVQMGTRFLATHESGASNAFKKAVIDCTLEDIEVATKPGSPSGLPFRVLKSSPFYQDSLANLRPAKCSKGWLLNNKNECKAKVNPEESFCICNGLLASSGLERKEKELYTVGEIAYKVDKIMSVKDLMQELVE